MSSAVIKQERKTLEVFGNVRNAWNFKLTNGIHINLNVEIGVSESSLNLSSVRLSKPSIDAGVRDATIFLLAVNCVKLNVFKGIAGLELKDLTFEGKGIYLNDSYTHSDVMIDMKIDVGVGDFKIVLVD